MRLTGSQREKLSQVRAILGCTEKVATQCLSAGGWAVDAAVDIFFTSSMSSGAAPPAPAPSANARALEALYQRYKDPHGDMILAEGVGKFCEDLRVDPGDVITLVISWHFNAAAMCEFSRQEFVKGMASLGCDSAEQLRRILPRLRAELEDPDRFKEIYNFAYLWSREKGQKCVQLDMATAMWRLLFTARPWPLCGAWCAFLEKHHGRAVSRDTWVQLLVFVQTIKPDLTNWEDSSMSAWPYLIDEFVEHLRAQQASPAACA